jgi:hypothetical protein
MLADMKKNSKAIQVLRYQVLHPDIAVKSGTTD